MWFIVRLLRYDFGGRYELPAFGFELTRIGSDAAEHFMDVESALAGEYFAMAMDFSDDFVLGHQTTVSAAPRGPVRIAR